MAYATSSSLYVTVVRRPAPLSGYRRLIRALLVGLVAAAIVSATMMGAVVGLGRLFVVSLEARPDIRSVAAIAPQAERLALATSPANAVIARWPVLADFAPPPVVASLSSSVIASAPAAQVLNPAGALAFVIPDSPGAPDAFPADNLPTGSLGVPAPDLVSSDIPAPAAPKIIPATRLQDNSKAAAAPAKPLPRPRPQLASLGPADGLGIKPGGDGRPAKTAIYDIAAQVVYLPNGERLEAHSGLGGMMDNPRSAHQKNRGVTPPNTYDLTLREALFHGVQAIRLIPVNESGMYGRDGILAHTYMLGPSGQSNGCVSFRNYQRFLRAYLRGEINRMVVVTHLDKLPTFAARNNVRSASNANAL